MRKGGQTHIEFILAFILFVTFVAFAVYIFNPTKTSRVADSSLPYAISEIVNNASVDLTIYSVKLNRDQMPAGETTIAISIPNIPAGENVNVEEYSGQRLSSLRMGDTIYVNLGSDNFIAIKFSEDFDSFGIVTKFPEVNESFYNIASSASNRIISEKRLLLLNESYYGSYTTLKDYLKIPASINFGLDVSFSGGNSLSWQNKIPEGIEVFSDTSRRNILRKDGSSSFADFIVRVW